MTNHVTHWIADPQCELHQDFPTKPDPDARCHYCRDNPTPADVEADQ